MAGRAIVEEPPVSSLSEIPADAPHARAQKWAPPSRVEEPVVGSSPEPAQEDSAPLPSLSETSWPAEPKPEPPKRIRRVSRLRDLDTGFVPVPRNPLAVRAPPMVLRDCETEVPAGANVVDQDDRGLRPPSPPKGIQFAAPILPPRAPLVVTRKKSRRPLSSLERYLLIALGLLLIVAFLAWLSSPF
ncbi:MAG: hypothetical protein V1716_03540 [Candidatus Uhrbacteria bacterium]